MTYHRDPAGGKTRTDRGARAGRQEPWGAAEDGEAQVEDDEDWTIIHRNFRRLTPVLIGVCLLMTAVIYVAVGRWWPALVIVPAGWALSWWVGRRELRKLSAGSDPLSLN